MDIEQHCAGRFSLVKRTTPASNRVERHRQRRKRGIEKVAPVELHKAVVAKLLAEGHIAEDDTDAEIARKLGALLVDMLADM